MKIKPANGVKGFLIYVHRVRQYMFRVYGDGGFIDYDLQHTDLAIQIVDEDSAFYENTDGTFSLDHAPDTLGIKTE